MYNNNYASSATRPTFDWSMYEGTGSYENGTNSYYYQYLIDEDEKTYRLVKSFAVPYSSIVSNVELLDTSSNIVVSSGMDHSFGEYDTDGNLIREFHYTAEQFAYRVFKYPAPNLSSG